MALIIWTDKLSVGVPEIDEQHKKLVSMINSLHDAMKAGKGKEQLKLVLDDVTNYVLVHFAYEEKLFIQYQYPEYKEHKAAHDAFVKKVTEMRAMYDQQRLQAGQLMIALQEWLIKHINDIDKRYSSLLIEKMKK